MHGTVLQNCLRGRAAVEALNLPAGHCMSTDASLDLGVADKASPFRCTRPPASVFSPGCIAHTGPALCPSPVLYTIPEPELVRRQVENTAIAATAYGVKGGNTVPYLGLGFGNRRYIKSMPSDPGRVPPIPAAICAQP